MTFSLRTLLLLFPALIVSYALAYGCAMQAESARAERPHLIGDHEAKNLRLMRNIAKSEIAADQQASMVADFNAYFGGKLRALPKIIAEEFNWLDFDGQDSWDNPYRCVLINNQIHFYSCGQDRKSDSQGNDIDDLNSWNEQINKFYREQYSAYKQRQRHLEALCYFPVTLGLVIVGWVLALRIIRKKLFRPSGAYDQSAA